MTNLIVRLLVATGVCCSLAGCYVYTTPPGEIPATPINQPQYYTGGVVPPNYVAPSMNTQPTPMNVPRQQHSTGGVIPPNYVPPPSASMNVQKHHATGAIVPSKKMAPTTQPVTPAPEKEKKKNPAST